MIGDVVNKSKWHEELVNYSIRVQAMSGERLDKELAYLEKRVKELGAKRHVLLAIKQTREDDVG